MVRPNLDLWSLSSSMYHGPYQKGLDHSYLHIYACLLLCFTLVLASLVLGFATLDALSGFVVVWLYLTTIRPCLDVTIWDASPWCRLLRAYLSPFPLHAMSCLPCLFVPPMASLHLCTLAYMFMHESCLLVCHPCFNTMKSWTFVPNLHLSPLDTTFSLPFCLFAFSLAFLFLCLPCLSCLSALCLFHMPYTSLSFHCLFAGFLFLPLHVHT